MDFTIWICCFLPLLIAMWEWYEYERNEKQRRVLRIRKIQRAKGLKIMSEAINNYIGKECIITTMNANIIGVVESVEDSWLTIKAKNGNEIVNVDYISRIREYPSGRSGKKKIVLG